MKTLFIAVFVLMSFIGLEVNQEKITVKAIFDQYEDETYYFTDENEENGSYEFQKVDEVASGKFDLKDEKYKGKKFEVTYVTETDLDENDDEFTIFIILDLTLIK